MRRAPWPGIKQAESGARQREKVQKAKDDDAFWALHKKLGHHSDAKQLRFQELKRKR
jgi:hypothetical protein